MNQSGKKASITTGCLLAISLACNIAALALPFMSIRKGVFTTAYTLPHSATMLWGKGLYAVSCLVIAFSILFPFAKLGVLIWVAYFKGSIEQKRIWLKRIEKSGKWSMFDVFLVSIILSLASKQFLIGAKPQLGLTLFIVAVLLSMICGERLAKNMPEVEPVQIAPPKQPNNWLLLLYSATLLGSLFFPFLRIEDWLLVNREYSIITLVPALWQQGAWITALLTISFLIIVPLVAWAANIAAWLSCRMKRIPTIPIHYRLMAKRWSMLDVFGLSLTIFTIESKNLMEAEIRWGALFLGVSLLLQTLFSQALDRKNEE